MRPENAIALYFWNCLLMMKPIREEIMHIALLYGASTTPFLFSVYQLQCTLLYRTYRDSGFYFVNVILLKGIYVDMAAVANCRFHCY